MGDEEDAAWPPRGMWARAFGWEQREELGEWAGQRGRGRTGGEEQVVGGVLCSARCWAERLKKWRSQTLL